MSFEYELRSDELGWLSKLEYEERSFWAGDQLFVHELGEMLELFSAPNPPLLLNEPELPKPPKADVPDRALKSAPPRKLLSGKPPKLLVLSVPKEERLCRPLPPKPSGSAVFSLTACEVGFPFCASVAKEGCIIRSKNTENCGPDTGLLEPVSLEALGLPPRSCESLKGVVLALRELMELKLMVLV